MVIIDSLARASTTTVIRDTRVYGVVTSAGTAGNSTTVAIGGNTTVNAVSSEVISIGDQLVTSTVAGKAVVDNNATTGIVGYAMSAYSGTTDTTINVRLAVRGGQATPNFRSNSTTAFRIQDANGTSNLLVANTTNSKIGSVEANLFE